MDDHVAGSCCWFMLLFYVVGGIAHPDLEKSLKGRCLSWGYLSL